MNLQPVEPKHPIFYATCRACGHRRASTGLAADLDGRPFEDYYCLHGWDPAEVGCSDNCPQCANADREESSP